MALDPWRIVPPALVETSLPKSIGRQPWIQVLRMEKYRGPLKQTVAAKAVFIEGHFNFPQAVVDAIKESRSKTPRLYFTVGPLILVLSLR